MPFGKRGLIRNEEPLDSAVSYPVLPPNPTRHERRVYTWRTCNAFSVGQGLVSFVYHVLASGVLAIAILFVSPVYLTRFANAMTPYWPLLARARPYMDAHGHHQLFLYMSAAYFKDAVLIGVFSVRNLFWMIVLMWQLRSKLEPQFTRRALLGLVSPLSLWFWIDQIYYGPTDIWYNILFTSVFNGGIVWGLILPAGLDALLVLYSFYSPMLLLFPLMEGGALGQLKQMRRM